MKYYIEIERESHLHCFRYHCKELVTKYYTGGVGDSKVLITFWCDGHAPKTEFVKPFKSIWDMEPDWDTPVPPLYPTTFGEALSPSVYGESHLRKVAETFATADAIEKAQREAFRNGAMPFEKEVQQGHSVAGGTMTCWEPETKESVVKVPSDYPSHYFAGITAIWPNEDVQADDPKPDAIVGK